MQSLTHFKIIFFSIFNNEIRFSYEDSDFLISSSSSDSRTKSSGWSSLMPSVSDKKTRDLEVTYSRLQCAEESGLLMSVFFSWLPNVVRVIDWAVQKYNLWCRNSRKTNMLNLPRWSISNSIRSSFNWWEQSGKVHINMHMVRCLA